jgi:hypothetical protein
MSSDDQWMASVIAEAEPIEEKPEVRAIWFDTHADAFRVCRIFGALDSDGKPVFSKIQRVLATLGAFEIRYLPVIFAATPEAAAREIERWAWFFAREVVQNANDLLRGSRIVATTEGTS